MSATHTLGPWIVEEVRSSSGRAFRIGAGEMLMVGKGACIIYDDYPAHADNERAANARLIGAAPDLLEAVRDLADDLESELRARYTSMLDHPAMMMRFERDMGSVTAARALIAKTEGA